jgi:hypothetical protein
MNNSNKNPFFFPSVRGKKVVADFDGGRLTSDGGVMLISRADRTLGIVSRIAKLVVDARDPRRIRHTVFDMMRARVFAICLGYEDADDLDHLRHDPALKLACGRLPDTGDDLCSQPTMSRLENSVTKRELIRMGYALVDAWMDSYPKEPSSVTLDIDDTCDEAYGQQEMAVFNAHYDERCFLPIHVYDAATSRPVAFVLRPGVTPSGAEVRNHIRRLVVHIRRKWTKTQIVFRGDGHYGRREAMDWCDAHRVDYAFGLSGSGPLRLKVEEAADAVRVERAVSDKDVVRAYAETRHGPKSWKCERRVVARIEATRLGLDIRYVVTSFTHGTAEWIYDGFYCARGQMENLIKLHKTQLASDRTSCHSALANQFRLVLHTLAYWLMLTVGNAIPKQSELGAADFTTLRLRLLKVAAIVVEKASRVRISFCSSCPEAELFRSMPTALSYGGPAMPSGP